MSQLQNDNAQRRDALPKTKGRRKQEAGGRKEVRGAHLCFEQAEMLRELCTTLCCNAGPFARLGGGAE